MKLSAFFLLLAAVALLLSGTSWAKYTENLTVQVFDNFLRPVEGAQVYVVYELTSVRGDIKTKPKITDSRGYTNILFSNYEAIDNSTNYSYTLFVEYGGQLVSSSLIGEDGERRAYSVQVESYIVSVRVLDQNNKPLQANVTINKATKPTDTYGNAFFALPPGNYVLNVVRYDLVKNIPIVIENATGDQSFDVLLNYYKFDILVRDDKRRPLSAQVEVNGVGAVTNSEGVAHFENITTSSPQVIVTYGQGIKRIQPNLQTNPSLNVIFDVNKPTINDKYSTLSSSGVGAVRFFVEDLGVEASGIDTVSVSYEVAGEQNMLSVYTIGYNSFEVKIPAQPVGTLVKYTITVSDKEGNTAVEYGNYVVSLESSPSGDVNASLPATLPPAPGISNESIFAGIAVLAVIAFAAIYYFNKKKASEIAPPPIAPPQVPQ